LKALVTGGGGFLGGAIVRKLLQKGAEVRSFSRSEYPGLQAMGVEGVCGDLADADAVSKAVEGVGVVFHVAAKAGVWGPFRAYHAVNVVGTENVVKACREHGVSKLIYTSTPSVTFAGDDQEGIDESAPYAERFLCAYPRTKAAAERHVLSSNDGVLLTCALRPHLIWGPGDPHFVPRIIERARAKQMRLLSDKPVDSTYVDNAADAHLLAAGRLSPSSVVAGKAYFISQGEPLPISDLINRILAAAELPPVQRYVSPRFAYVAGAVCEFLYGLLSETEPPMTRFVARQLATAHWFDLTAARRDLGYDPAVSIDEGMKTLAESLQS
jgi:nucleoside-diphosphate-sugar epimerase